MQIKWSKPSSREKGWFPRTSYSTSATRNPQQISKARHLLSLILAANTTGKNWMILSVMLLDILRRVWCCFQPCLIHLIWSQLSAAHKLDQRRQLWFKTKGNYSNSTGLSLLTFSRICVFFSWQLGQVWLFKCKVFFFIGHYHFFPWWKYVAGYLFCSCSIRFVAKGCKYLPNIPGIELFNFHQLANFSEMPKKKFNIIEARWDICIS